VPLMYREARNQVQVNQAQSAVPRGALINSSSLPRTRDESDQGNGAPQTCIVDDTRHWRRPCCFYPAFLASQDREQKHVDYLRGYLTQHHGAIPSLWKRHISSAIFRARARIKSRACHGSSDSDTANVKTSLFNSCCGSIDRRSARVVACSVD
jgi:hypothetical protein